MEKQVQSNVTEPQGTETQDNELLTTYGELVVVPDIKLTRSQYSVKGQKYWSYRIVAEFRGRAVTVEFVCRNDVGGYNWLDIVFGSDNEVDFAVQFKKNYDRKTKMMSKSYDYYAVSKDEELDQVLKAPISPSHGSDRAVLDTLLERIEKKYGVSFEG